MANDVKIVISAVDNASAAINKVNKSVGGMKISMVDVWAGINLAQQGFKVLSDVIEGTVGVTVDYNKQIREMTQVTGMGAEEISRIVQVGDDWGISIEQIRTALAFMNKQGITPSIDTLAKMADEYVASADKSKWAAEAVKVLGRGYQTLIPLFAKGGDALREQTEAISDNLIATEKSIKEARDYEVALDNLGDAVLGVKMAIGKALVPTLTQMLTPAHTEIINKQAFLVKQIGDVTTAWIREGNVLRDATVEYNAAKAAITEFNFAGRDEIAVVQGMTTETEELITQFDSFLDKQRFINYGLDEGAIAAQKMAKGFDVIGKNAEEAASPVKTLLDNINVNIDSPIASFIKDLEWWQAGGYKIQEAFELLKKGVIEGKITPQEADVWAKELYVETEGLQVALDQTDATAAAENISSTLGISLKDAKKELRGSDSLEEYLQNITATTWYIDIVYTYSNKPPKPPKSSGGTGPGHDYGGQHGLNMKVPSGFPNDTFPIFASSGERVIIQTPGQQAQGKVVGGGGSVAGGGGSVAGGGDIYATFNITTVGQSVDAIVNKVMYKLGDAMRYAQAGGGIQGM